jgi:hypothetical protein
LPLASSFLAQNVLKLPLKTPGQMPSHARKEIIHYNEMKDEIFTIDMIV